MFRWRPQLPHHRHKEHSTTLTLGHPPSHPTASESVTHSPNAPAHGPDEKAGGQDAPSQHRQGEGGEGQEEREEEEKGTRRPAFSERSEGLHKHALAHLVRALAHTRGKAGSGRRELPEGGRGHRRKKRQERGLGHQEERGGGKAEEGEAQEGWG